MNTENKTKLKNLWNSMWDNGMTNPLTNIQQITYLIFIKMLDDNQIIFERKINDQKAHGIKVDKGSFDLTFKTGNYVDKKNKINVPYSSLRWSVFKEFEPKRMYDNLKNNVFPFIKQLHGNNKTAFSNFMKDAQFLINNPVVLSKLVNGLSDDSLGLNNVDMMGDSYEELLNNLSINGDAGQFRTPRHIIKMMVELAKPTLKDTIVDPAMGTAGFLAVSSNYISEKYSKELLNRDNNKHFNNDMFTGFDVDPDMLRIGCMNMTLHGVKNPTIKESNSLYDEYDEKDKYSLVFANPPFSGSLDSSTIAKSLKTISGGTKKTELLFLSLFLRILQAGGRCVSIVPVGVLNNTNDKAYTKLRKELVENQKLEAIIYMPSGIFKPYSGVETAIIMFTKTTSGGTDKVWLYNMEHDGFSLDDKRNEMKENDIPDILTRWKNLKKEEKRTKYDKSFFINKNDIKKNDYILTFNKYHKTKTKRIKYRNTKEILSELKKTKKEEDKLFNKLSTLLRKDIH